MKSAYLYFTKISIIKEILYYKYLQKDIYTLKSFFEIK